MDGKKWAIFVVLVGMACLLVTMFGMLFGADMLNGFQQGMYEAGATRMAIANPATPIPPTNVPTKVPTPTLIPNCQKGWLCSSSPPQCYGWGGEPDRAIRLSDDEISFILDEPGFVIYYESGEFFENRTLFEADFCRVVGY